MRLFCENCRDRFDTYRKARFCCWDCRVAFMVGDKAPNYGGGAWMRGEGNPKWRGGISKDSMYDRFKDARVRAWRRAVFARDAYRCRLCRVRPRSRGTLRAHHLAEWAVAPLLRYEVSNGVTLCWLCHHAAHCKGILLADWAAPIGTLMIRGDGLYLIARRDQLTEVGFDWLVIACEQARGQIAA